MLKRGVYWVIIATALDFGSSWIMMTLYGPSAEGNPIHRTLFEHPTVQTFFWWLPQQWSWFVIGLVGVLGITVLKLRERESAGRFRWLLSSITPGATAIGLVTTWVMAFARLLLGLGSNVAGMLLPLGAMAQLGGWMIVAVLIVYVMESDFFKILRLNVQPVV